MPAVVEPTGQVESTEPIIGAFTNINGFVSGILKLNDYLRETQLDVVGLVETKLRGQLTASNIGN